MKKILVINLSLLAVGCMLMGAFKLTDISSSVFLAAPFASGLIPPATEFSEIQYPGPIVKPDVNLKPQELGKHDFRLDIDDKPVYGPSAHSGYVMSATAGKMLVQTPKGILTYTYVLPGTAIIPVAEKDKVSVRINQGIPDNDQNFVITDSVNGKLLHSSGRQGSNQPVKIQFSPDTRLYQTDDYETIVTDRHYLRYISVIFQHGKYTTKIIPNKKNIITIDGEQYAFVVVSSSESHPTPAYAAQSEWEGYYLEYYIAKNL
jgi:hypothetical protein